MARCPRCGTGLLPGATICTSCCHRLDGTGAELTPLMAEVAQPDSADLEPGMEEVAPHPTDALLHWPFGGADDETLQAVSEAQAVEMRPQLERAAEAASYPVGNGLGIPNQRGAAFHPLRVSSGAPPNRYLAAERRQQTGFRSKD